MAEGDWIDAFLAPLGRPAEPSLAAAVQAFLDRARAEEPSIEFDLAAFLADVGERSRDTEDLPAHLETLRAGDLLLAWACGQGSAVAVQRFQARFGSEIDAVVARSTNADISRDDFRQHLMGKLFAAADGERPRIAEYSGRGDLRGWLRVTIVRQVIDFVRRKQRRDLGRQVDEAELLELKAGTLDPELAYLKNTYRHELSEALREGFAALSPRDRNLLRHFLVHGLGIDEVGRMYNVHRTTAHRWRQRAQDALLEATRAALHSRLGDSVELRSAMNALQSEFHITVQRYLPGDLEED